MAAPWKTVRVFISSTFLDMQAERDHLVRFVFPKLRAELLARRIHLVEVDLRWGVTSDQDAQSVCREIVDECRPRFLCMLGGRYGWVPPGQSHSITADEVQYGVLDRLEDRGYNFFYFRDPAATAAMVETTPGEYRERSGSENERRLEELKASIEHAGLDPFIYPAQWDGEAGRTTGLKDFDERVYRDLKLSIDQEFGEQVAGELDEAAEEDAAMEAFIEERTQRFVLGSRDSVLSELLAHANGIGDNASLCLVGEPGSGKSALLAYFSRQWALTAQSSVLLIHHFVGASTGSTDPRRTLQRLCRGLTDGTGIAADVPDDPEQLRAAFVALLEKACTDRRVVIVLDAIDSFDCTPQLSRLWWLPERLPDNARLILSALPCPALDELRQRGKPPREIALPALAPADAESIVKEFLNRYRKAMADEQRAALLAKTDAVSPLYLLAALEELRTLGTYEIEDRIAQLPSQTEPLFAWIMKRLEDDDGFRDEHGLRVGHELVQRFASLMAVSRHGLSQRELGGLLAPGNHAGEPRSNNDTLGNVAALVHLLRPYLMRRGELLDFGHGHFRSAAETAFLETDAQRRASHGALATYFSSQPVWLNVDGPRAPNLRRASELPFHRTLAGAWKDLELTLTDLDFVEAKCSGRMAYDLVEDYQRVDASRASAGPLIVTARDHEGRSGIRCPDCLAWFEVAGDQLGRVIPCAGCSRALQLNSFLSAGPWEVSPPRRSRSVAFARPEGSLSDAVGAWGDFVKANAHVLNEWPALTFQEASNWVDGSAPNQTALARWGSGSEVRPWLRRLNKRAAHAGAIATLTDHTKSVTACAVSPDGRTIVSVSDDGTARLWNADTGAHRARMAERLFEPSWCGFSSDGLRVAVCNLGEARIFDAESGSAQFTGRIDGRLLAAAWMPQGLVLALMRHSESGYGIEISDIEGGTTIARVPVDDPMGCAISPDASRMLTWCRLMRGPRYPDITGYVVHLYDVATGAELATDKRDAPVAPICTYSPDGQRIASLASKRAARFWSAESGEDVALLEAGLGLANRRGPLPKWLIENLMSASDEEWARASEWYSERTGQHFFIGGYNNSIRLLAPDRLEEVATIARQSEEVLGCAYSPDGRHLLCWLSSRDLAIWDAGTGESLGRLRGHSGDIRAAAYYPDGRRIVSGAEDGTLRIWDASASDSAGSRCHFDAVVACSFSADGRRVVTGSKDRTTKLWDVGTRELIAELQHSRPVTACAVSGDGRRVASFASRVLTDEEGERLVVDLKEWDADSATERVREDVRFAHDDEVRYCEFLPDGLRYVSRSIRGDTTVWDQDLGHVLAEETEWSEAPRLTPDGRFLQAVEAGGKRRLWDLHTPKQSGAHQSPAATAPAPDAEAYPPGSYLHRLSPDGRYSFYAHADGTLRVLDVQAEREIAAYVPARQITSMDVSPTAAIVAVGDRGGSFYLLELEVS